MPGLRKDGGFKAAYASEISGTFHECHDRLIWRAALARKSSSVNHAIRGNVKITIVKNAQILSVKSIL
jgi:hypothetical protein